MLILKLCNNASILTHGDFFPENIVFNGEVTVDDFKVEGNLEGININKRLEDAVRLTAKDVIIRGTKNFVSNVTFKNIFTTNLNNVDFNAYLSHAVRKNVPITLNKRLKVNGLVSAPSVTANSLSIRVRFHCATPGLEDKSF